MKHGPRFGYRYPQVDADNLRHELYVTSVGCLDYAPGETYPAPGHPEAYRFVWSRGRILGDFAVVLLSRGRGTFETRSSRTACRAGDAFVIPPGVWHRYRPDPATGWREHWVCANGEFLHRLRAKRRFIAAASVLRGGANVPMRTAHRRLWDLVRDADAANDLALAACALEVFARALPAVRARNAGTRPAPSTGDPLADAAREYIRFNSHRPLSVGAIARHIGISRRTLERRYARTYGVTVVRELIARRVERARQLLTDTRMSVKEISYAVGFGNSRRLIRNFSRAGGPTPAAFRRLECSDRRERSRFSNRRFLPDFVSPLAPVGGSVV